VRPPVLRLDLVGPRADLVGVLPGQLFARPPEHVLGPPQFLLGDHELGAQARDLRVELVAEHLERQAARNEELEDQAVLGSPRGRPDPCTVSTSVLWGDLAGFQSWNLTKRGGARSKRLRLSRAHQRRRRLSSR
jgi:hypothetical protein